MSISVIFFNLSSNFLSLKSSNFSNSSSKSIYIFNFKSKSSSLILRLDISLSKFSFFSEFLEIFSSKLLISTFKFLLDSSNFSMLF